MSAANAKPTTVNKKVRHTVANIGREMQDLELNGSHENSLDRDDSVDNNE